MFYTLKTLHSHIVPSLSSGLSSCRRFAKIKKYSLNSSTPKIQVTDQKGTRITTMRDQDFDYFLVLDFEATCEEGIKIMPHQVGFFNTVRMLIEGFEDLGSGFDTKLSSNSRQCRSLFKLGEIIEFPVVQLCGKSFEEVGRFHRYVRPTERPILTSFCTDLTGIIQENVTNQDTLPEVLNAFNKWLIDSNLINTNQSMKSHFTFITCGDWDLGVLLPSEANYRNLQLPKQVFQ
uniref:Exonuclease domain-containing protein n=1 Tax=Setaria digitata TaxID=48799 RepID=A0A915PZZ4_9BILA